MEYMTTYGWALLLIAVVAVLLYFYIAVPSTIVPSRCAFIIGASCNDMVFGTSSSHATEIGLFLSNNQPYALLNPTLIASINGKNYTFANDCKPGYIPAGGEMICILPLPISSSLNQFFTGSFYLVANYCGLAANTSSKSSCSSAPSQVYKGAFTAHAEPLISPGYNVTLSVENSTNPADGAKDTLTATAYMLGYPVSGAEIGFYANFTNGTSAVPPYIINSPNSTTGTSGVAQSVIYGYKAALVNVTADYFGKTATKQIRFAAITTSAFAVCTNQMMHSGNTVIVVDGKAYTCSQITNSPPLFSCNSTNPFTFTKYLYVSPGIRAVFNYVDINGVKYPSPSGTITVYNCTKPIVIANYTDQYEFNEYANPTYNYSVNGGEVNASPLSGAVPYNLTVTPAGSTMYYHYQAWFDAGSNIKISEQANPSPSPGWVFNSWTCGINTYNSSATCYSGTTGTETISMHGAINETANFWANLQMLVYPSQPNQLSTGGTTTPSGITSYPYGTAVQITAKNYSGFEFHEWQGTNPNSYTGTANPTTIDMYNPITENAIFNVSLLMVVYPSMAGNVIPSAGAHYYPYGTTVAINVSGTNTSVSYSEINSISSTVAAHSTQEENFSLPDANAPGYVLNNSPNTIVSISFIVPQCGATCSTSGACPSGQTCELVSDCDRCVTSGSTTTTVASTSSTIQATTSATTSVTSTSTTTIPPQPNDYLFHNWTCSGTTCYQGKDGSASVTLYTPVVEQANFNVSVVITANQSDFGTVGPATGYYRPGSTITLSATADTSPSPGYSFHNWTCTTTHEDTCYSGTGNPKTITVGIHPFTEQANFWINLEMSIYPSPAGTTSPGVGIHPYPFGSKVPINVSGTNPGYQAEYWTCTGSGCYNGSIEAVGTKTVTTYSCPTATSRDSCTGACNGVATNACAESENICCPNTGDCSNPGSTCVKTSAPCNAYGYASCGTVSVCNTACTGTQSSTNTYSNPVVTMDNPISETANFYVALTMKLSPSNQNAGHTVPGVGVYYYPPSTYVNLQAVTGTGWRLTNWAGSLCFNGICYSPSTNAGAPYSGRNYDPTAIYINYYPITETAYLEPFYLYAVGGYCSNCNPYTATATHLTEIIGINGSSVVNTNSAGAFSNGTATGPGGSGDGWAGLPIYKQDIATTACTTFANNVWCQTGYTSTGNTETGLEYNASQPGGYVWECTVNSAGQLCKGESYPIGTANTACVETDYGYTICIGGYNGHCDASFLYICYEPATATNAAYWTPTSNDPTWYSALSYHHDIAGESCVYDPSSYYPNLPNAGSGGVVICIGGYTGTTGTGLYPEPVSTYVNATNSYNLTLDSGSWQFLAPYGCGSYPTDHSSGIYCGNDTSTNQLIDAVSNPSCVYSNGYVYCVGGYTGPAIECPRSGACYATSATNFVLYAPVDSLLVSTSAPWQLSYSSYPKDIAETSCATAQGEIFCVGGYTGTSGAYTDYLNYANLTCLQTTATNCWQSGPSYPFVVTGAGLVITNNPPPITIDTTGYYSDPVCTQYSAYGGCLQTTTYNWTCTGVDENWPSGGNQDTCGQGAAGNETETTS